jgi:hypothetical protein
LSLVLAAPRGRDSPPVPPAETLLKIAITGAGTVARSEACSSGVAPFCTQAKKSPAIDMGGRLIRRR